MTIIKYLEDIYQQACFLLFMLSNFPTVETVQTQNGGTALIIEGYLFIKNRDRRKLCLL